MMNAADYLKARALPADETQLYIHALTALAEGAEKGGHYTGFALELHPRALNDNVLRALQITLAKTGWALAGQLMAYPSRIEGGPPIPVKWQLMVTPTAEAYNNTTVQLTPTPDAAPAS